MDVAASKSFFKWQRNWDEIYEQWETHYGEIQQKAIATLGQPDFTGRWDDPNLPGNEILHEAVLDNRLPTASPIAFRSYRLSFTLESATPGARPLAFDGCRRVRRSAPGASQLSFQLSLRSCRGDRPHRCRIWRLRWKVFW